MKWATSADLRAQVQRMWDRGDLLRAAVSNDAFVPIQLKLKAPSASDVQERFEEVRGWVSEVSTTPHVKIEWREWNHRVQGTQRLPAAVTIGSLQDAIGFVGKTRAVERFRALWQQTSRAQPSLLPWMSRRPLIVLELAERWERLLSVVVWLQRNPRPNVYLRQVDAPGVDSKFIEAHRSVLAELLALALQPDAIDSNASGTAQFTRRFGFMEKPLRMRFRLLDPSMPSVPGCKGLADITLDSASFADLDLPIERVFVTENEINFLAFPPVARSIVAFGAGYGWDVFARAAWLHRCRLHYWGDIDTHGFAILNQLRGVLPHAASFLMDTETLLAHRSNWGTERDPARHDLSRLTAAESMVYDDLRFDRLQSGLRLEQEMIAFRWVSDQLNSSRLDAP